MSNYPDYRISQTGYEKESNTIDKDDIIRALEEENRRLKGDLSIVTNYADQYIENSHLQDMYDELKEQGDERD